MYVDVVLVTGVDVFPVTTWRIEPCVGVVAAIYRHAVPFHKATMSVSVS
jgi:hypothetical protein